MNGLFKIFLTAIIIGFTSYSFGISDRGVDLLKNRRKKHPVGVNVNVLGVTGWGNVSADWFINPKLNVEGGFGIQNSGLSSISYFAGIKYHLLGKTPSNLTPYFGVFDAFFLSEGQLYQHNLYFPIGLHKIKRNKFSWAIEMAYQYNKYAKSNIWGAFKIGYRIL